MDENAKRMMEQLKADPALMIQDGGKSILDGAGLQRAMQAAMRGDTNIMAELVGRVAQSPEGAALMERVSQRLQK